MSKWENNEEIKIFREYLRIPSVHPNINYDDCVEFLHKQAKSLDLPLRIYCPASPEKPVVVISWVGIIPELPTILLNSHMDVVPVFEEFWTHPPFAAEMDEEGRIFARGAQDMKCVGVQYLAAIRALRRDGIQLKRTVHVMFTPDEEIGNMGMAAFVATDDFKALNIAFTLDEGCATPTDVLPVFYAERSMWRARFKIGGSTGHGSLLLENTIGEKIQYLVNKMNEFRSNEVAKLDSNPELTLGDVTSINLTMLKGGAPPGNVVPPDATLVFEIRLALNVDHKAFEEQLNRWCAEAGGNIKIEYELHEPKVKPTVTDRSNPFWTAFKSTLVDDLNLRIKPQVFPAGTDSDFIRRAGIPALGFSPIDHTPVLLHDNDEFLGAETFLVGIEIYRKLIPKLANV